MLAAMVAAVEAREELWRSERLYSASMAPLACKKGWARKWEPGECWGTLAG